MCRYHRDITVINSFIGKDEGKTFAPSCTRLGASQRSTGQVRYGGYMHVVETTYDSF